MEINGWYWNNWPRVFLKNAWKLKKQIACCSKKQMEIKKTRCLFFIVKKERSTTKIESSNYITGVYKVADCKHKK